MEIMQNIMNICMEQGNGIKVVRFKQIGDKNEYNKKSYIIAGEGQ